MAASRARLVAVIRGLVYDRVLKLQPEPNPSTTQADKPDNVTSLGARMTLVHASRNIHAARGKTAVPVAAQEQQQRQPRILGSRFAHL